MKNLAAASGVATQIVFDYPNWGEEHVSDMLDTYKHTGGPAPCDYDELMSLACKADDLKKEGKTYEEVEQALQGK